MCWAAAPQCNNDLLTLIKLMRAAGAEMLPEQCLTMSSHSIKVSCCWQSNTATHCASSALRSWSPLVFMPFWQR